MEEKEIYVVLTDTGTLFTRLIKLYTKKSFNHASISFDKSLTEVYSFGRKTPSNPFIGGFVKENMKSHFFRQAKCRVYSCTVSTAQYESMIDYIQKIDKEKSLYRYNLLGLFAILLNKQINRKHAFFCSQFVATVLQECDCVNFSKPPSLITPHDLIKGDDFNLVYEGNLRDWNRGTGSLSQNGTRNLSPRSLF
ncbi:hypothetical protein [Metabacillus schmidteae]|uniref:hypothetical protein n=1 Tax=Metabacillus schmidteae TaxID=2730405 RepID=UPI00158A7579|nr:hypothetical protein [Metabacillus schmidteae]